MKSDGCWCPKCGCFTLNDNTEGLCVNCEGKFYNNPSCSNPYPIAVYPDGSTICNQCGDMHEVNHEANQN